MKWRYDLGSIIRENWKQVNQSKKINQYQKHNLFNLSQCRTAALGGHINGCTCCPHYKISYNSCRNRHCPSCQSLNREIWILKQEKQLLSVPYFHVAFTIPHELNDLCMGYPRQIYYLLFKSAWETIQAFAADSKYLGAKTGMTSVLHTWGQNLMLHPHVHCIIPAGGITKGKHWKSTKSNGKYLFPKNALRKVFKGKFMYYLKKLSKEKTIILKAELREKLYSKKWIVYAKQPFLGPKQVIEYLGRYTHKVAISNYRIKALSANEISFNWKNYSKGGAIKLMTLPIEEFLRRFSLHFLPKGFVRMRHYGILSSRGRHHDIPILQKSMGIIMVTLTAEQLKQHALLKLRININCPKCKKGEMHIRIPFGRAGPPKVIEIQRRLREMR